MSAQVVATLISGIFLLGLGKIAGLPALQHLDWKTLFAVAVPLLGTFIGVAMAFWFAKENLEAATETARERAISEAVAEGLRQARRNEAGVDEIPREDQEQPGE